MDQAKVQKIEGVVSAVVTAGTAILALIAEAGVGGHLNEEQAANLLSKFGSLATLGLEAFATAHDVEITPESVLALLPAKIELVEPVTTPSADDLDKIAEEQKAVDATSGQ